MEVILVACGISFGLDLDQSRTFTNGRKRTWPVSTKELPIMPSGVWPADTPPVCGNFEPLSGVALPVLPKANSSRLTFGRFLPLKRCGVLGARTQVGWKWPFRSAGTRLRTARTGSDCCPFPLFRDASRLQGAIASRPTPPPETGAMRMRASRCQWSRTSRIPVRCCKTKTRNCWSWAATVTIVCGEWAFGGFIQQALAEAPFGILMAR